MANTFITQGKDLEDALKKAAQKLNCPVNQLQYEILKERSFLGMFNRGCKIKVWRHDTLGGEQQISRAEEIAQNLDGYFELDYTDEGVFLTIHPPQGNGRLVEYDEVEEYVKNKKIKEANLDTIKAIIFSKEKKRIKIAEPQEEFRKDAELKLEWSKDKLEGFMTIVPPLGGKDLSPEEVFSALEQEGISYGVDKNKITDALTKKCYNEKILIARGKKPANGKNAKIEYYFNRNLKARPTQLENGSVDFFNLNIIQNVRKGQVLARKIPRTMGVPGMNIFGEEIPPKEGKDIKIPMGKNVALSKDGLECYAEIDGHVTFLNGKINVYSIYEVVKDVDTSTGNINFNGTVIVRGNVRGGFSVKAEGDLIVYGWIEAAELEAKGNVVLQKGMQGKDKGSIQCEGNLTAKYIEHSKVNVKGDIAIEGAVMHSCLNSGGKIEIKGKKGLLVGGTIRAKEEVKAKTIGSPMGTKTVIEVGVLPEIKEKYNALKEEVDTLSSNLRKIRQAISLLEKLKRSGNLTQEKALLFEKLEKTVLHLEKQYQLKKANLDSVKQEMSEIERGRVKASNAIYPGVKVIIGNACKSFTERVDRVIITKDGADIKIGLYEGDEA